MKDEADNSSWQTTYGKTKIHKAQSWNPETNDRYRDGNPGDSAYVKDIEYDSKDGTLTVKYKNNHKSVYKDVTEKDAQEFMESDSKGRWAYNNLGGNVRERKYNEQ